MRRLILVFTCFLLIIPCRAEIITVDDDGIANFNTIQAAIDYAVDGDIIIVQPGTYQESIRFLGKNVVLTSSNPSDSNIIQTTLIDGEFTFNSPRGTPRAAVIFRGDETAACGLVGFKINGPIHGFDFEVFPNGTTHTQAFIMNCVLEGVPTSCGTIILGCDGEISNCIIGLAQSISQCVIESPAINRCHGIIRNCTIYVGKIEVGDGNSVSIINSIIRCDWQFGKTVKLGSGATLNIMYTNLENGLQGIELTDSNCVVNWEAGNFDRDPCFVRVGYWDFNESLTFFEGDYHLQSAAGRWDPNTNGWVADVNTSAGIDAGNPGCPTGSEPAPNGNRINIGAFGGTATASKSPENWAILVDLTNDYKIDFNDLAVFVSYWLDSGDCIPSDFNRNQSVDFVDYAIFGEQWQ